MSTTRRTSLPNPSPQRSSIRRPVVSSSPKRTTGTPTTRNITSTRTSRTSYSPSTSRQLRGGGNKTNISNRKTSLTSQQSSSNDTSTISEIRRISLTSNAKKIVKTSSDAIWCGCKDGTIHVLDSSTGDVLERLEGPIYSGSKTPVKIDVTSMALIDNYVWTGSNEGTIRLWDSSTCMLYNKNYFIFY